MELNEIKDKLELFKYGQFQFDEQTHTYTLDGKEMESVTTWISQFSKPFDSDYWSKRKAKEWGMTQEEVLKMWNDKAIESCRIGHAVHSWIEEYLDGIINEYSDEEVISSKCRLFNDFFEKHLYQLTPIAQELKVFNKDFGLSGTIDALFYYNGKVVIADWKTNGSFTDDTCRAYNNLSPPFDKYPENSHNYYSLQINVYELILESIGIPIGQSFNLHLGETWKVYKTKNFKSIIKTLF